MHFLKLLAWGGSRALSPSVGFRRGRSLEGGLFRVSSLDPTVDLLSLLVVLYRNLVRSGMKQP